MNQGMVRFTPSDAPPPPAPISLSDIQIFTVQGHPEFNEPIVSKIVVARAKAGVIDAAVTADAVQRAGWQNDGVGVVGKAILGVFGFSV